MQLTIDALRNASTEFRRWFAKARPDLATIRLRLNSPQKRDRNGAIIPDHREIGMRGEFYQLPQPHQTRSRKMEGVGSMDAVIRAVDDSTAINRMPAGIHRDVVGAVLGRGNVDVAGLIVLMRRELRMEQESRRDAFELADSYAEELEAAGGDRASILAASQLREECRADRWPDWADPYIILPNAIISELSGGAQKSHRERAILLGRSKFSYTSAWRAPYEWLHARYEPIYRAGLMMLDGEKG